MSVTALAMADSPAATLPVLLLRVAGQTLAIGQQAIAEILPLPRLAPLPEAPPILTGSFSLGDTTVFVLPLGGLLGLSGPAEGTALYHHLLLLPAQPGEVRLALSVDRVTDMVRAEALPRPAGASFNGCVEAEIRHEGEAVPLLSLHHLLTGYERERLQAFTARESSRAAIFRPAEPS